MQWKNYPLINWCVWISSILTSIRSMGSIHIKINTCPIKYWRHALFDSIPFISRLRCTRGQNDRWELRRYSSTQSTWGPHTSTWRWFSLRSPSKLFFQNYLSRPSPLQSRTRVWSPGTATSSNWRWRISRYPEWCNYSRLLIVAIT